MISCFLQAISLLFLGTSHYLYLPNLLPIVISGYFFLGIFTPFTIVSAFNVISFGVQETEKSYDPERMCDMVAVLFGAGYSLGTIIGPLFASYLSISGEIRFNGCCEILALICLIFALVYYIVFRI
jgi:MFS family permease